MVYDFLPIQTSRFEIHIGSGGDAGTTPSITLIRHHVPAQILRVCRAIRTEAQKDMREKVQEIREMTPKIILDSAAAPGTATVTNILEHVTHWLYVLMTDESTNFQGWRAQLPVTLSSTFSRMSEPELHLVEQAGHQMLSRWRKLEFLQRTFLDKGSTDLASVFFAIRVQDKTSLVSDDTSRTLQVPQFFTRRADSDGNWSMLAEDLFWFSETVELLQRPIECLVVWDMTVDDGERNVVRALTVYNSELRQYLGVELK